MMYGLKPFNSAELRQYLDILGEQAPAATNPDSVPLPAALAATPQLTAEDQQHYESVQEDELSEIRKYLDMVEADETPTGAGQFTTKQMGDGTKVSFDPVTGGKTVSGATGTTSYNVAGQKTAQASPSIGGFQKTTNYQTGEKTTTGQVGGVGISMTQRPDQSTVKTASTDLGDVTATTAQGIGFGGAGKDVQPGGNQMTSITTPQGTQSFAGKPTAQQISQAVQEDDLDDKVMAQYNAPQAKAKSQAIDKAFASGDQKEFDRLGIQSPERIERDLQAMRAGEKAQDAALQEDFPGTHGAWMHGGFKVTYDPASQTVRVQGKNQDRSHKFTNAPTNRSYHDRVQQIIDRLEDESELRENPSLVMREWMTLCR